MAAKRYQPSLNIIPEELQHDSPSSSSPTMFNIPLQQSLSKGMGDKRNSIEQWLQSVPNSEASANPAQKTPAKKATGSPGKGSLRREITAPKERPPPPPLSKAKTEEASVSTSPSSPAGAGP